MDRHTHTSLIVRLLSGLVFVALMLALALMHPRDAAAAGSPNPYAAWSNAQIAARVQLVETSTRNIGEQLIDVEERRAGIDQNRTLAREQLAQWMADAYTSGTSSDGLLISVLGGGDMDTLLDRVQAARTVSGYHLDLVAALDESAARLEANSIDKATFVHRLTVAQRELVALQGEQARRARLVAEQRARAAAERAEAARKRSKADALAAAASAAISAAPSGALVGYATPAATNLQFASGAPSAQLIDAYLASKGSPMAGNGAAFMMSGARWQVDPRLVVAIAGAESSFGAQTCGPFNAWGWACPNDPADFADWAGGIETITRGLRKGYLDEGRTSVMLIQQKYAPSGAANDPTGLNLNWVNNVSKFLGELGGNPSMVGPAGGAQVPGLGAALLGE